MFKKSLLIFLVALVIPFSVFAQGKIAGIVTDKATGEPLSDVNIVIKARMVDGQEVAMGGVLLGASSNANGEYFILNVPVGIYKIEFSYVGYKTQAKTNVKSELDLSTYLDIEMEEGVLEMGEEITIVAERPLVEKSLTASKTGIDVSELNNTLPINTIDDVIQTAASTFNGYVRGGRKFETKTLVDGVDVSDSYFSGGTGRLSVERYTQAIRTQDGENNAVGINQSSVQAIDILAGTFNAEYEAATAGIINIVTKDGGQKYSGKVFFRSSAGGLGHKGPNVYAWETDLYNAEKLAKSADYPDDIDKRYNWTPDKYSYGDGRTMNTEISFGGPLGEKGGFFLSNRYYNSNGRFPGEFQRTITTSLKLHYNISRGIKLTGNMIVDDGGQLTGFYNRPFTQYTKFYMEGTPRNQKLGLMYYLNWQHTLSNKTYYEIKFSKNSKQTEIGYTDGNNDGWIDYDEDGDFLIIDSVADVTKYYGDDTRRGFYVTSPWNDSSAQTSFGNGVYKSNGPGYYYEDLKRSAMTLKFDMTSQVTFNHQLKFGFLYKKHTIEDFKQKQQLSVFFDPNYPFEQTDMKINPKEYGMYFQDKIEYQGIIINAGVRLDGWKSGGKQYDDLYNPAEQVTDDWGKVSRADIRNTDPETVWKLSPRLGISHPISDNAAMHYSWGKFIQPPQFSNMYDEYGTLSNPSLPNAQDVDWAPPEATAYEMGLQFSLGNDWGFDVTAYYRDIDNYGSFGYQINTEAGYLYYFNTSFGYADSRGIEVSVEKRPTGWLSGRMSYAYSYIKASARASAYTLDAVTNRNAYTPDMGDIPLENRQYMDTYERNVMGGNSSLSSGYDRKHKIGLTTLMSLPYGIDLTSLSDWASGFVYPVTATTEDTRLREQAVSKWTMQTDVRLSKWFTLSGSKKVSVFLEIRNLFDRTNIVAYSTADNTDRALWEEDGNPQGKYSWAVNGDGIPFYDIAREMYFGFDFSF